MKTIWLRGTYICLLAIICKYPVWTILSLSQTIVLKHCEEDKVELWSTLIVFVVRYIGFDTTPWANNFRLASVKAQFTHFWNRIKITSLTMLLSGNKMIDSKRILTTTTKSSWQVLSKVVYTRTRRVNQPPTLYKYLLNNPVYSKSINQILFLMC